MPLRARSLLPVLVLALLGACRQVPTASVLALGDGDVVWRLPDDTPYALAASPDGALFLSTMTGAVYRGESGGSDWLKIAQVVPADFGSPHLQLQAFSRSSFFAVAGSRVYQWTEGGSLREHDIPTADSTEFCSDYTATVQLRDMWGRDERDVYVVGTHGTILHYDGASWTLELHPLHARALSLCEASLGTDLHVVGGDAAGVYAAGSSFIRKSHAGRWEEMPRPEGEQTSGLISAVVALPGGVLYAGGDFQRFGDEPPYRFADPARLFRLRAGRWDVLTPRLQSVHALRGGSAQLDGQALFWNEHGDIVIVRDRSVRLFRVSEIGRLRGAVLNGRDLYITASAGDTAVVVRLRP
ncbi:hypothetical protein [Longimicrobium terrae]|uniref:Uncharacterized protein n=1 Tax=Longimicrobium terrae TaxID=1639882 RepID=A0A841GPD4_9BACT|nr:hypothetical protein [Longimicrobium terrae]MBB4634817.1 hypothetical protein [Longimicrobium terrae]MBB6069212.1 hypothetical protein [Longimicrobium terrae]NNC31976.1 hypothetical protein [Longimicrobium terrae]